MTTTPAVADLPLLGDLAKEVVDRPHPYLAPASHEW